LKVDKLRKIILGSIATIVVIVLGYSLLYTFDWLPSFGEEPERYITLERALETDPVSVEMFFTFSCPHCRSFDPLILDWAEDLPEGVEFIQSHVAFTRTEEILARSFLTLDARGVLEENRERIFRELQDRGRVFLTSEAVAEFVDGSGMTKDQFLTLYGGDRIDRLARTRQERIQDIGVSSVPFVLVGNKYGVFVSQGRKEAVSTVDYLVSEILAGREPPDLSPEPEEDSEEASDEEDALPDSAAESEESSVTEENEEMSDIADETEPETAESDTEPETAESDTEAEVTEDTKAQVTEDPETSEDTQANNDNQ